MAEAAKDYLDYYHRDFPAVEEGFFWFVGRSLIIRKCLELAKRLRGGDPIRRVVEIGCGAGGMLKVLTEMFGTARGYDGYEPALEICRRRGLDASQSLAENVPEENGSADLVCAFDVIEHLEDDRKGLAECARVLRPGGMILVTVPALRSLWSPVDDFARHFRRYEKQELIDRLKETGFEPLYASFFMTLTLPLFWMNRLLCRWGLMRSNNAFGLPPAVNAGLKLLVKLEALLFQKVPFPRGSSLIILARKKSEGTP